MFERILVPVTNPQTQENLLTLASLLARPHKGKLMVVNVAQETSGHVTGLEHQREVLGRVPEILKDPEAEIELIPRLAHSFAQGILYTALERKATLILMGWRGKRTLRQSVLGTVLDEVIWGSETPVLVGSLNKPLNSMRRVTLILPAGVLAPQAMRRMLEANFTLAKALNVPLSILSDQSYMDRVKSIVGHTNQDLRITTGRLEEPLKRNVLDQVTIQDLLVIPGFGSRQRFLSSIGDLAERLATSFVGNLIILHFEK